MNYTILKLWKSCSGNSVDFDRYYAPPPPKKNPNKSVPLSAFTVLLLFISLSSHDVFGSNDDHVTWTVCIITVARFLSIGFLIIGRSLLYLTFGSCKKWKLWTHRTPQKYVCRSIFFRKAKKRNSMWQYIFKHSFQYISCHIRMVPTFSIGCENHFIVLPQ